MTRELSHKAGAALLRQAFADKNASLTHTEALNILARLKGFEAWSHLQQAGSKRASANRKPKTRPTQLVDVLRDHYGEWGQLSALPRDDWSYQVGEGDTSLGYWDWVVSELAARDLYAGLDEYTATSYQVTLPDGKRTQWSIECNLTDRWGDLNYHAPERKPSLAILHLDEALDLEEHLTERLRAQMWDECTFLARKDGAFGLLFEIEYASRESEAELLADEPAELAKHQPHAVVVRKLLEGLGALNQRFDVDMCVPDAHYVIHDRPAVWAFVPMDTLEAEQREQLGRALLAL